MFDSVSAAALRSALDGLASRQRATADNIANINTPHYLAARVDFESALRDAVGSGSGVAASTESRSTAPTREDGNNVDLDTETLSNLDTQLRYQLVSQAMSGKFSSVSLALKTS
ncbi:flagellar basal body rod protein FlgB [Quadrisphaera sp. INWT6]|uniref:flagellar basal body rod protein FlgB n=1 Tax=Quadrisphaera sp. INWT6 TaxID=2596917 RepID=UPI0018921CC6|nr:flagellar basal body protein [Quadrisphaera sp. INWT6]MBF5083132.1 flagellar biosynthesis protein FlgB [Quadrisphaera sp. INWT6]